MKFEIEHALEILSNTPLVLHSLLGNLSDDWTASENNRDDWSPFDIVGHYIHAEETDWIPRAAIILEQDANQSFEPFDRYAQFENSQGKNLGELLETFADARKKSLETLKSWNLTDEHLRLKAIHPELGLVNLEQLLSTWVVHDLTHIRQIVTNLAKKYAENVGVWREYLSILK
jgi:uncharacterized protein YbjQ (UPF0145 family)